MSPSAELRVIQRIAHSKPFVNANTLVKILNEKKGVIMARRIKQTDLDLEAELRMCEIRRCLPILKEITC